MPTLKRALLTLIQQDIVQPSYDITPQRQGATKKPRPPRVIYSLQVASLRHRTRFASYLLWVKQLYNADCEVIMQTLLLHGKLSSKQVMDITCANINDKNRMQAQETHKQLALAASTSGGSKPAAFFPPPPMPAEQRRSINDVFRKLIAARYIVRANGLSKPEDQSASEQVAASGSTGFNSDILATFLSNNAAAERKQQEASEAAASAAGASAAQAALKASTAAGAAATKKRKKIAEEDEDDAAAAAAGDDDEAKPIRKKKKTKKELEAEAAAAAREKRTEEAAAARQREENETQASLDRASAAIGDNADVIEHDDAHILWSVNHAEFIWEFRKKAVVDYVNGQIGTAAGFLIQQLMQQYPSEVCSATAPERPPVYDVDAILHMCERGALQQNIPNPVANLEMAEECLHQLLGDSTGFFERKTHPKGYLISKDTKEEGESKSDGRCHFCYHVLTVSFSFVISLLYSAPFSLADFPQLFTELKLKHIQSICRSRFGSLSARIFRCLLVHKRLEETQVSEYATAPRKEVRRLLYAMHNAKMISMQEVPRSSDRMPARTFFVWGVDVKVAQETYLESLYFAWCNLRRRLELETEKAKPILDKVDTSKPITDEEKGKVETWKKAADRLEAGLHQLNQLIMLFQDF